jgi:hypothetical protein
MASMTSCGQTTNETPALNEDETRITVILDTLKNDYYWQRVPSDSWGRIPLESDYEREREIYPFRAALDNYRQELDTLLDKNLSEDFLINLLNKKEEYRQRLTYFFDQVPDKLLACQSDSACAALYRFWLANPEYADIAIELVVKNRYKDKIQNNILQAEDEIFMRYHYHFHIFDKKTQIQFVDRIARYAKNKLDINPELAYYSVRAIVEYYQMEEEAFENTQTKTYLKKMRKLDYGKKYVEAQNNYYREWTKNVLRYYELKKK